MFVESRPEKSSLELDEEKIIVKMADSFDQDLKNLSAQDAQKVNQKLYLVFSQLQQGNIKFLTNKLKKLTIPLSIYTSSLYVLRIDRKLRIILFFEDDPIFSQKIVTLLHIALHSDFEKNIKGLAESYYQKELTEMRDEQ